jgi:hypothetical protein
MIATTTSAEAVRRTERWLRLSAIALASLVLGSWLMIAVARVDDSYGTVGPWTGLSFYANHGTLYPPLFDGASFGGTRYLPLQFLLYAGGSHVTGEYFVSAKIVVAVVAAALLALVYVAVRSIGCCRAEALAATGTALATAPAMLASLALGGDSVAVLMQLGAVTTIVRRAGHRAAALAGGLCALAFLAKLSAVWAPLAIALWLFKRERRTLATFAASYLAIAVLGVLTVYLASDGRLVENLFLFSSGGARGLHAVVVDVPRRFVMMLGQDAQATWLLVPIAVLGLLIASARRQLSLYQLATLGAVLVTLAVLTDEGTYWNHLVDVSVLLPIVAAEFVVQTSSTDVPRRFASSLFLVVATVGMATGYLVHIGPHLGGSLRGIAFGVADPEFTKPPLKGLVDADDRILSEDASIVVATGQRPVVLDPYMLLRILRDHPDWEEALVQRIDAREFDKVVLLRDLDPSSSWYTRVHFGRAVASAIDRNYRLAAKASGYRIYVARGRTRSRARRMRFEAGSG